MVCRAVSADEAGGGPSLADRLVSGVMSSQVQHAVFYLIHLKQDFPPPNVEALDPITGIVLRICPLDTWREKEGGGRWLGGQCEGRPYASSMCCFFTDDLSLPACGQHHMLCAEALA